MRRALNTPLRHSSICDSIFDCSNPLHLEVRSDAANSIKILLKVECMEEIKFYSITISDYSELFEFWNSIDGLVMHKDFSESTEGFKLFLERNPELSLNAKHKNKIVGAIMCSQDGRRGYLNHLAVSKEYHGKGIGTELVSRSLKALKRQNIHKTTVPVLKSNINAQKFWNKIGFSKEDIIEMHSIYH